MMKTMIAVTLALAALMLGLDKVRNEHAMTREYRRQADALERIADAARVGSFGAIKSAAVAEVALRHTTAAEPKKFDQATCGPVGADCKADCPGWGRVRFKEGLHFDEKFLAKQGVLSVRLPEACR
jgi:hypothetical protein